MNLNNDFAVAKEMNLLAMGLILATYLGKEAGIAPDYKIQEKNRAYILLVNELQKIYESNHVLADIKPEPIWKRFEVIKFLSNEIIDYIKNEDPYYGGAHYAKVEKLCILNEAETPNFTKEQQDVFNTAQELEVDYFEKVQDALNKQKEIRKWQISEYTMSYKPDGSILINDVLRLKKIHAGSITERLLEQVIKQPNTLLKPELGQTSRNISTVLHSAGFTPVLRQLFFPTVSNSNGLIFRPTVSQSQTDSENIDTTELDLKLHVLGAVTEPINADSELN